MNKLLFVALTTLLFALTMSSAVMADDVPVSECGNGTAEPGEGCDPGNPAIGIPPDLHGKGFPATGQTACWDTAGNVIDCAGTGHDGDVRAGAPLSYRDNGDGTITDDNTGLMWEKKDDSGGIGIHDKDATYTWSNSFSVFIDKLNNTCEGDGLVWCDSDDFCGAGGQCGFAGYRDWRMPNIKELQSIVNYQVPWPGPTVAPAFNTNCVSGCTVQQCSCTVSSFYWSSSSFPSNAYNAWDVYFRGGNVFRNDKNYDRYVRAVRGGS